MVDYSQSDVVQSETVVVGWLQQLVSQARVR